MKVKILIPFHDKGNYAKVYKVGEIADFDDDRASRIIESGYGEPDASESPNEETPEQASEQNDQEPTDERVANGDAEAAEDAAEETVSEEQPNVEAEAQEETDAPTTKKGKGRKPRA